MTFHPEPINNIVKIPTQSELVARIKKITAELANEALADERRVVLKSVRSKLSLELSDICAEKRAQ
jgi:hypothetical protein